MHSHHIRPADTVCAGHMDARISAHTRSGIVLLELTSALSASYIAASGCGFDAYSPRMPDAAFLVDTSIGADRLVHEAICLAESRGDTFLLGAEEELRREYQEAPPELQRCMMISLDHSQVASELGSTSPQATMVREMYAAAALDAACHGVRVPYLEPMVECVSGVCSEPTLMKEIFDDAKSGYLFNSSDAQLGSEVFALAKAKTNPDDYSERQMRSPEWDEPKQSEIAKIERLGAKTDVAADDPSISHLPVIILHPVHPCD